VGEGRRIQAIGVRYRIKLALPMSGTCSRSLKARARGDGSSILSSQTRVTRITTDVRDVMIFLGRYPGYLRLNSGGIKECLSQSSPPPASASPNPTMDKIVVQPNHIKEKPHKHARTRVRSARFCVPGGSLDALHGPSNDWHPKAKEEACTEGLYRRQRLCVARQGCEVVSV